MIQAIGSEVAAETSRSAEMKAPAKSVAVSRAVVSEANIEKPLFQIVRTRPSGPCPYHCKGRANLIKSLFFSVADPKIVIQLARFAVSWDFTPLTHYSLGATPMPSRSNSSEVA